MTSKKFRDLSVHRFALTSFLFLIWVILLFCVPTPPPYFWFQAFHFQIEPVLCTKSLHLWLHVFCKQAQQSLYNMLQERTETGKEKQTRNQMDGEQTINTSLQRTFTRKISQYRQVKMMSQNLLFPYLHL